ncbi:MAG: VRR-NUC domain-containing protein [Nanoarchaeota archaeon]
MTPETALKQQIKHYLQLKRVMFWSNLQGLGAHKGLPDIFALRAGIIYAIEVKTKKGNLSEYQQEFLKEIELNGGISIVARKLEDVIEKIY